MRFEHLERIHPANREREVSPDLNKRGVRNLLHQKARVSREPYLREKVTIDSHLAPFFAGKLAAIRRVELDSVFGNSLPRRYRAKTACGVIDPNLLK